MGDNTLCHRSEVTNSQAAISARNLTLTLGTAEAPVEILRGVDLDVANGDERAGRRLGWGWTALAAAWTGARLPAGRGSAFIAPDACGGGIRMVAVWREAPPGAPSGTSTR